MVVIAMNVITLRRLRAQVRNDRYLWVVRRYEDAHLIFLVSAGFGGMLGAGRVPGEILLGVRDAHLQLNALGWAGLTVLTTLVVFGPALLRVPLEAGAEQRASDALLRLRIGTLGLVLRSLGRSGSRSTWWCSPWGARADPWAWQWCSSSVSSHS